MPNHWISTCNPKRWDIWGFLDDGNSLSDIENWSVSRYFVDMAEDEDAVLWVAGEKRGCLCGGDHRRCAARRYGWRILGG